MGTGQSISIKGEHSMTAGHDIPHGSDLVAGPKPVLSAARDSKLSIFDRFSTPLWIAVGISVIVLALLAALG
jgi:hypothetical protein